MSGNNNNIYGKAIPFMIVALVVILVGTIVTVFIPLMTKEMHPKLETLKPYTALEMAGRNIYQKEGCMNCHTQTVRPLKSDVVRYGEYSKAGENFYERPFLWGSKRTGPDLARIGGKYTDTWHVDHFMNPRAMFAKSNMPKYDWFATTPINTEETARSMDVLKFPYTPDEIKALKDKKEMDAIVAYMQVIGTSVPRSTAISVNPSDYMNAVNPFAGNEAAIQQGKVLYDTHCYMCHGYDGKGNNIGAPIADLVSPEVPDGQVFVAIANGLDSMMPGFLNISTKDDIWHMVAYVRSLSDKAADAKKE